ncbi:MAG: hypothetical protein Q9218_005050 [Villophora microphyllina]
MQSQQAFQQSQTQSLQALQESHMQSEQAFQESQTQSQQNKRRVPLTVEGFTEAGFLKRLPATEAVTVKSVPSIPEAYQPPVDQDSMQIDPLQSSAKKPFLYKEIPAKVEWHAFFKFSIEMEQRVFQEADFIFTTVNNAGAYELEAMGFEPPVPQLSQSFPEPWLVLGKTKQQFLTAPSFLK